jgi:hypothetical protein
MHPFCNFSIIRSAFSATRWRPTRFIRSIISSWDATWSPACLATRRGVAVFQDLRPKLLRTARLNRRRCRWRPGAACAHLKNSRTPFLCLAEQGIDSEQIAYGVACVARSSAQASQGGGAPFLPQRFTATVVIACPRPGFFSSKSHRALSEAALPASRAAT